MRGHARLADVELAPPPHAGEPLVHCPKLATTVAVARERDAMILLELTAAQHTLKFNVVRASGRRPNKAKQGGGSLLLLFAVRAARQLAMIHLPI
jgi:hypothetical protein